MSLKSQIDALEKRLGVLKRKQALLEQLPLKKGMAVFHKEYGQVLIKDISIAAFNSKGQPAIRSTVVDANGDQHAVGYYSLNLLDSMSRVLYDKE
jgi:hypothetical protein